MADTFDCTIPALVDAYPALKTLDKIDAQSLTVLILAAILRELGGSDLTDICALAESMRQYDGLPEYDLQSARLAALANLAQAFGVTEEEVASVNVRDALECGHCCQITPSSMRTAETYLWCLIANAYSNRQ